MSDYKIHLYSDREERLNTLTHLAGAILGFVGLVLMIIKVINSSPLMIFAMLVYAFTTLSVFSFSAIYHGSKDIENKIFWQKIDHSMVSLIIAGTATPTLLVIASGPVASIMLCLVLFVTAINILLNVIDVHRFKKYSLMLYLGAIIFMAIGLIFDIKIVSNGFLVLMISGAAVVFIGGVFYMLKSREYTHVIWHISDIICSILHFLAFYIYIAG